MKPIILVSKLLACPHCKRNRNNKGKRFLTNEQLNNHIKNCEKKNVQ
jgi:hypothetical protein